MLNVNRLLCFFRSAHCATIMIAWLAAQLLIPQAGYSMAQADEQQPYGIESYVPVTTSTVTAQAPTAVRLV